jgi:hypothetical protein
MKRLTVTALAVTGLLLTACSGGSSSNEDGTGGASSGDQTTTTVDERVTPPTLPAGQEIATGSIESTIQELDQECADAIQPIRDLQKKYQSALEQMEDADLSQLNDALSAGFASCSADDWSRYQELELKGWLYATPSDEAIEQAQQDAQERQDEQQPAPDAPTED